jgi:hypothetical protein
MENSTVDIEETPEFLDKPNTCRIAVCDKCGRTIIVSVWDDKVGKETKRDFSKAAATGYEIKGVSVREARNVTLFHTENCPNKKKPTKTKK